MLAAVPVVALAHDMFVMNKSDHKVVICYGHVNKYYNICNNCSNLTPRDTLGGGIRNVETISSVHSVIIVATLQHVTH